MKLLISILLFLTTTANATSVALYNFSEGKLETSYNQENIVPIASITKLFTAAAILESGLDLNEKVKIVGKTKGRFIQGTYVSRLELMKAMLIASDNLAADSLAHSYPHGYQSFINFVNVYVEFAGLENTKIFDASGLSVFNVSTANDLINFLWYLRRYPLISSISSKSNDNIEFENKKHKSVKLQIKNTNPDIKKYEVLISKTGFTSHAGRCLAMLVQKGEEVFGVVVLGFKTPKTRSEAIENLINK